MLRLRVALVRQFLVHQWTALAVVVAALVAFADPMPGKAMYPVASPIGIAVLFLLLGLTVNLGEFQRASTALPAHLLLWSFQLLVCPAVYWLAVYRWGWEVSLKILRPEFAKGCMAALCMPTTASTSLVFTQQADGDASFAALNMAGAQLIGAVVSPAVAGLLLGTNHTAPPNLAASYAKLSWEVVAPLVGGVLFQVGAAPWLLHGCASRACSHGRVLQRWLSNVLLVVLLWLIFSKAFGNGGGAGASASSVEVVRLFVWVVGVHLTLIATAWAVGRLSQLNPSRHIAFVLVGPQKTEGMAIALFSVIFPNPDQQAMLLLPVVAYHSIQMLIAAACVPLLRSWGIRRRTPQPKARGTTHLPSIGEALLEGLGDDDVDVDAQRTPRAADPRQRVLGLAVPGVGLGVSGADLEPPAVQTQHVQHAHPHA
jgi:sodium/bile acid cotransporter 7